MVVIILALFSVFLLRLRHALARRALRSVHKRPLHVAFLHPDLGIGGAERLVVDAALSLHERGHVVSITTAHHDASRCFVETCDGTLSVQVVGSFIPRNILGKFHIICATLRALVGAAALILRKPGLDAVVVDQVPAAVPLLRVCGLAVVFYCHFPDKLLSPGAFAAGSSNTSTGNSSRSGGRPLVRQLYRLPFDLLEEACTGCASIVLVNSDYTAAIYAAAFNFLRPIRQLVGASLPTVLHPSIDLKANGPMPWPTVALDADAPPLTLVSINRFERKKALELALHALRHLRSTPGRPQSVRLVLAGGFDHRLKENVEYYAELEAIVKSGGMEDIVELRCNISDEERRTLFATAAAIVYTPSYEHFGIVPLEAMAAARPVIAVGLGGPCESIEHGRSGWLCEPTPDAFEAAFTEVIAMNASGELRERGAAARARVEAAFARPRFGEALEGFLRCVSDDKTI